ncbi:hypothetical protein PILCRDRAFT_8031 [Piloderma croceum F 1598]|uniref:Uncharacterized protein n=1 Tax=Piloderma croceum (strain F 1598) TaxID=765440 RepID=A0A0C3BXW2_PILCF|nr:hypothetical protein PILCRDRAFT_8031 [Piloderma croceum F 1598]
METTHHTIHQPASPVDDLNMTIWNIAGALLRYSLSTIQMTVYCSGFFNTSGVMGTFRMSNLGQLKPPKPFKPHPIILENWTRQGMYLTQVAACSKPAFDFNNLTQILEGKRVEKAGAA